jgi:hypothetical protein
MPAFTIVFSLFGLVLGLSMAAVLQGLGRVLRMRPKVKMGWLTPLLGAFILLDLISFWNGAWRAKEWIQPEYGFLFIALIITGTYYLAASSVFPDAGVTFDDFDRHYFENRRWILLAIGFCNLAVFGWQDWLNSERLPTAWWFIVPPYFVLVVTAAFVRGRALSIACLVALIGLYLVLAASSLAAALAG